MRPFSPARVKRLRKKLGITQKQLAPLVHKNLHFLTVSRWERGVHPVGPLEAEKLAELESGPVEGQSRRKAGR